VASPVRSIAKDSPICHCCPKLRPARYKKVSSWVCMIDNPTTSSLPLKNSPTMLASIIVSSLAILGRASPIPQQDSSSSMLIESARDGKCLAPSSNVLENGTQIISVDCGTAALWDIVQGSGSIILSGTNFAIDLGLQPGNNGPIYVSQPLPHSMACLSPAELSLGIQVWNDNMRNMLTISVVGIISHCGSADLVSHG
jgi:hypothetical protein